MPTSDLWRVRTVFDGIPGLPGVQTLYFDANTGTPQSAVDELEQSYTGFQTMMNTNLNVNVETVVDQLDPVSGNITAQLQVTSTEVLGTNVSQPLSLGTQGLVQLNTGVFAGGRQIRGRAFFPAPCENENDDGTPTTDYNNAALAALSALVSQGNVNLVVYSPTYGVWHPIAAMQPSQYWARIRSRQR